MNEILYTARISRWKVHRSLAGEDVLGELIFVFRANDSSRKLATDFGINIYLAGVFTQIEVHLVN